MRKSSRVERRVDEQYDLTLRRSFLFYVPKPSAYGFLGMGLVLAVIADVQAPPTVWLGPVYLFLIAFAAWAISGLLAVAIGSIVVAVTWAGGMDVYPYGQAYNLTNMAIRFLCLLMIVLFLTIARRSCEKEWQMARIDPLRDRLRNG